MSCPNAKLVGEKVECQLKVYSEKTNITFQVDYGNNFVQTFSLPSKSSRVLFLIKKLFIINVNKIDITASEKRYGINIPINTPPQFTSINSAAEFLLTNSEIREDSVITGIELFSTHAGDFWLSVS